MFIVPPQTISSPAAALSFLLMMLETWKEATDNNKAFGALLTDLSKAFDCLSHDLLIAKLHAYGLNLALGKRYY